MKRKTVFASIMAGALLLAGCSAQKNAETTDTKAASSGAENVITLSGSTASCGSASVNIDGGTITITAAGTYELTGTLDDGMVIVDAGEEDVELVLNNASITSGASAAIYIASCDDAVITLAADSGNTLANGGGFTAIDEKNIDGVIYARKDLTLSGSGSLTVSSPAGHGIVAKDDLTVEGGAYTITAASHGVTAKDNALFESGSFTIDAGKDGVHCENSDDAALGNLTIRGGEYTITAGDDGVHASGNTVIEAGTVTILESNEGIEGQTVTISGGAISVTASDDGLNAAGGNDASGGGGFFGGNPFDSDENAEILIEGGTLYINAGGDGIDSNGTITMTGGQVFVSGPTNSGNGALDYGISATITGGTIVAAGASGMAENFTSAEGQGVMLVSTGAQAAGSTIQLADASGNVLLTWQADKAYECVVISTPDVQQGGDYTVTAGSSTQTVEMTSAVYGGGMGMGGQPGQMGQMGGQPGQMGCGRPGGQGGMGRP